MSMIAIDEDEYALETVYAPGRFTYTKEKIGTRYVLLGLRTFVDPSDLKDVERVHALQDSVRAEQPRTGTFEFPNWDPDSQKKVREDLIKRAASLPDTKGMFGPRGKVDPERHLIVLLADSTVFSTLFGADDSLKQFWKNLATAK